MVAADAMVLSTCLRPWYDSLRELGSLKRHVDELPPGRRTDPRPVWIQCDLRLSSPMSEHCLEGIALLTLLARVNGSLWRDTLKEIWASDSYVGDLTRAWIDGELRDLTSGEHAEAFAIGVSLHVSDPEQLSVTGAQYVIFDTITDEMRGALEQINVTKPASDKAVSIRIPVDYFVMIPESCEDLNATLRVILDLKEKQLSIKNGSIHFNIVGLTEFESALDVTALELLVQCRAMGIRITICPRFTRPAHRSMM